LFTFYHLLRERNLQTQLLKKSHLSQSLVWKRNLLYLGKDVHLNTQLQTCMILQIL
ncbi:hypothetical protein GOODEAATRI_034143, partial [Goodea atripinnis]